MLSKRADAFEEVAKTDRSRKDAAYDRARDLVSKRADEALEAVTSEEPDETGDPQHTPYTPHRPLFSPAARRLIRAHERIEDARSE